MAATPPGSGPLSMAEGAVGMHEFFTPLLKAGFSEQQALYLVGQLVAAGARRGPPESGD